MVSDLNKTFGGSTDLAKKRHGSADLHTPIHPPPLNTNEDCMLLSGVLVVMAFEITFLGSGVGVDYRYF